MFYDIDTHSVSDVDEIVQKSSEFMDELEESEKIILKVITVDECSDGCNIEMVLNVMMIQI